MSPAADAVLQLSNDYLQQDVYRHLTDGLAARGVRQFVFMSARKQSVTDRCPKDEPLVRYAAPNILKLHHKVMFRMKSELIYSVVERTYDLSQVCLVHAHFLFSDGQVARMLHERRGMPFVVSVRPHTDIDSFMRLRPDLMPWGCENLLRAQAVICLSPGSRDLLLSTIPSDVRRRVRFKIHVIPHGLAPEWHEAPAEPDRSDVLRILSVGDMTGNKNVRGIVKAIDRLVARGQRIELTLVGGRGRSSPPHAPRPWIQWIPHVADRLALREIVRRHHIFMMPSFSETFGVAYVESLSQGLPAIRGIPRTWPMRSSTWPVAGWTSSTGASRRPRATDGPRRPSACTPSTARRACPGGRHDLRPGVRRREHRLDPEHDPPLGP
jgi:glycosyltransferase involved in cell wall biosynthesis